MIIYKEIINGPINEPFDVVVNGEIFTICKQNNNLIFYYYYQPQVEKTYTFLLAETGQEVPAIPDMHFMGTFMLYNDIYVLHTFMRLKNFEADY